METTHTDVVADPVGHISISGLHGPKEIDARVASARHPAPTPRIGVMIAGALIGAAVMYLLHPDRRARRQRNRIGA